MPKIGASINIEGLDEFRQSLDSNNLTKQLAPSFGLAIRQVHNAIKTSVISSYNVSSSDIDKVLIGNSPSQMTFGLNSLNTGLSYEYKAVQLSKFVTDTYSGNINADVSKEGQISEVTIRRGKTKIVKGNQNFGGFLVRRVGFTGNRMYIRLQDATWLSKGIRAPIARLYAPSITDMINNVLQIDTELQQNIDSSLDDIVNNFTL
jgi:hypothetical protein